MPFGLAALAAVLRHTAGVNEACGPVKLRSARPRSLLLRGAAAVIVATAVFRRTGHKYRDRSDRCVLADLKPALENLRLAAAALDAMPIDDAGFTAQLASSGHGAGVA